MLHEKYPYVHVSNFTNRYIAIPKGLILGHAHNPGSWLDKAEYFSEEDKRRISAHATLIRTYSESNFTKSQTDISSKAQRNATEDDDPLAEEPIEGGPKTSEAPPEEISEDQLLKEVGISKDLTENQRKQIIEVL